MEPRNVEAKRFVLYKQVAAGLKHRVLSCGNRNDLGGLTKERLLASVNGMRIVPAVHSTAIANDKGES